MFSQSYNNTAFYLGLQHVTTLKGNKAINIEFLRLNQLILHFLSTLFQFYDRRSRTKVELSIYRSLYTVKFPAKIRKETELVIYNIECIFLKSKCLKTEDSRKIDKLFYRIDEINHS